MRVVPFATRLEVGGTEKQLVNLLTRIDRGRFELRCACLRRHGKLLDALPADCLPLSEFPIDKLYGPATWRQQFKFSAWAQSEKIDVVHTFGMYANVFALPAAWATRRPALIGSVREQTSFWRPAHGRVNLLALRLADRVITNACSVRDDLVNMGLPAEKLRVIPNGVEVERFARPRGDAGLRAEIGWPADCAIVAVLSRMNAGKGIEDFLDAAAQVVKTRPATRFLVVGDGAEVRFGVVLPGGFRGQMRRRAADLGLGDRVCFLGHRLDIPEILAQVDVSILPSRSEALSNALLESMAAGAPVVATRVGDHALVVDDGASGLLCPAGDPAALARATGRLLDDRALARRLGDGARRVVEERFSMERMVRATEDMYLEAADATQARRPMSAPRRQAVEIVRDAAGLAALAAPWRRLEERVAPAHPFATHEWVSAWWEAFGAGRQLEVVVARGAGSGEVSGVLPLVRERTRMFGVPLTRLSLCANEHTPRSEVLADDAAATQALLDGLGRRDWDVLVLPQLEARAFPALAGAARVRTAQWNAAPSPFLRLTGDHESYLAGLSPSFRANLRRARRRLERLGALGVETIRGGAELPRALADGFALEAAAWKGANGTAIASDPAVLGFYERLAAVAAERGWLELRFLTVGERRVACNYALRYRGALYLLKHGYDPELARCSPASVLCDEIIAAAYRDGLHTVDFLGGDDPWKARFTSERRPQVWLYGFAGSVRARLVEAIKFKVVPFARDGVRAGVGVDARSAPFAEGAPC